MRKSLRRTLTERFGYETYAEFREHLKEAKQAYAIRLTWKCIAKGRRADGSHCIVTEQGKEDPSVDEWYTTEQFTYIRFKTSHWIYRYRNPVELVNQLKEFDGYGNTDMEEGDEVVLEPMTTARSLEYSEKRRKAIKDGTWIVKPRGPNPSMRRPHKHYYRPF